MRSGSTTHVCRSAAATVPVNTYCARSNPSCGLMFGAPAAGGDLRTPGQKWRWRMGASSARLRSSSLQLVGSTIAYRNSTLGSVGARRWHEIGAGDRGADAGIVRPNSQRPHPPMPTSAAAKSAPRVRHRRGARCIRKSRSRISSSPCSASGPSRAASCCSRTTWRSVPAPSIRRRRCARSAPSHGTPATCNLRGAPRTAATARTPTACSTTTSCR